MIPCDFVSNGKEIRTLNTAAVNPKSLKELSSLHTEYSGWYTPTRDGHRDGFRADPESVYISRIRI